MDEIKNIDLFESFPPYLKSLFEKWEYPWEILPHIEKTIDELLLSGIPGFSFYNDKVLIGENVKIAKTATIEGKAIIGSDSEIRPGAFIRGNLITGQKCVLGNSSEFKNAILLDFVQCPHYNYVGDSILGNHSHTGAGVICSNLKADKKLVIIHGEKEYETGIKKVGAFLGDCADIGCQSVLNPGTIIGKSTIVYPLTPIRGVIKKNKIVKAMDSIVDKR